MSPYISSASISKQTSKVNPSVLWDVVSPSTFATLMSSYILSKYENPLLDEEFLSVELKLL